MEMIPNRYSAPANISNKRLLLGVWLFLFYAVALGGSLLFANTRDRAKDDKKAKLELDLHRHPTGGQIPVVVQLGLYVTNLVAIDETRETFEISGYFTEKWRDPRLVLPDDQMLGSAAGRDAPRSFSVEELWAPPVEVANAVSHKRNSYSMQVDRSGNVTYIELFNAVLSNDYHLRRFPFDSQVLRFEVQPFLSNAFAVEFAPQRLSSSGISPEQHVQLAAWRIGDLRYSVKKFNDDHLMPSTPLAVFQIHIERRLSFYWWKILLPLFMLTIIPSVVFWVDANQFDWMLKVPITMLLSMVAFEFAIVRDLPKIGYITFLDAVFIASFAFCFLCILEITLVFVMYKRGMELQAEKVHAGGRWIYPSAYLLVLLSLAIEFLT